MVATTESPLSITSALRRVAALKPTDEVAPDYRVSVISNAVLADATLFAELSVLEAGLVPEFTSTQFAPVGAELLAAAKKGLTDIIVVIDVDLLAENLAWGPAGRDAEALEEISRLRIEELASGMDQVPPEVSVHVGVISGGPFSHHAWPISRRRVHSDLEGALRALASLRANVHVLDFQTELDRLGIGVCFDTERVTRHSAPLTTLGERAVGEEIAKGLLRSRSTGKKVLVLDGDNTLWGGVLGELGASGVHLDPTTYPGNVYYRAQLSYRALKARGALLCLVSKNEPHDVQEMLISHPHSILRPDDFVAIVASWDPKAQVILQLADELNLDPFHFVFVDDSDWELGSVVAQIPSITTCKASPSADYFIVLERIDSMFLASPSNTLEDRTERYRVRAEARRLERSSKSREEFLQGMESRITARRNCERDFGRVAEMSQRTNQFNLGLSRLNQDEVAARVEGQEVLIVFDVEDRFGDSGTSVALFVRVDGRALVSDMWISCRVLGRGIEEAVIGYVAKMARESGFDEVAFHFREGPRNQQVHNLLSSLSSTETPGDGLIEMRVPVDVNLGEGQWVRVEER